MTTLPLTLTPIDDTRARERLERAGDVSASLVESLTYDEIRTLCGNVERDAERGADAHAVPTALLFRLLRTALTGPREEDPMRAPPPPVQDSRILAALSDDGRTLWGVATTLGIAHDGAAVHRLEIRLDQMSAAGRVQAHSTGALTLYSLGDDALRREVDHARSAVRGRVGGAW